MIVNHRLSQDTACMKFEPLNKRTNRIKVTLNYWPPTFSCLLFINDRLVKIMQSYGVMETYNTLIVCHSAK